MTIPGIRAVLLSALVAAAITAVSSPASAALDALKGASIRLVIASSAGGSTDKTGRAFADVLGKLVPSATIRVQDIQDAAGGVGMAEVQNAGPGAITIGLVNAGVIYAQLAGTAQGQFDLSKLQWLGAVGGNQKLLVIRKGLGPPTLDTLMHLGRPPVIAISGVPGSQPYVEAELINALLPLHMKVVGNLDDATISTLLLSGQIDGTIRSYANNKPMIDSGDVLPVLLFTRDGLPAALQGLPTLGESVPKGVDDPIVRLIVDIPSRMFMAAPVTTPAQLAALTEAFEQIVASPEFQATLATEDRAIKHATAADLDSTIDGYFAAGSDFTGLVAKVQACGDKISRGEATSCQ